MLFDPGSMSYKNWLAKTTTLDDIYRHYYSVSKPTPSPALPPPTNQTSGRRYDTIDDDYEEGVISGYAIHKPFVDGQHEQQILGGGSGGVGHYDHSGDISGGYSHHHQMAGSKYGLCLIFS